MEAIAEAVRSRLPLLFWIADNGLSISTRTRGKTFFSRPDGDASEFYGLPLHRMEGRDCWKTPPIVAAVVERIRVHSEPAVILSQVERLSDHTNADDERAYRSEEERHTSRVHGDPVEHIARHLRQAGVTTEQLLELDSAVQGEISVAVNEARATPSPAAAWQAGRTIDEACSATLARRPRG